MFRRIFAGMIHEIELCVSPKDAFGGEAWKEKAIKSSGFEENRIKAVHIIRRSIDARQNPPVVRLRIQFYIDELPQQNPGWLSSVGIVKNLPAVHIIGTGPAGYFAALELLELGIKPILFDRGKQVRERRRDLRAIQQFDIVNPDSNYCFGEGGAGTYSDGKLYTKSLKRGNYRKVLELFVEHGADSEILIEAHPHIGSNKLPGIVENIRNTIIEKGGEIHFNSKITDILFNKNQVAGIRINNEKDIPTDTLILATGHSARDIFSILRNKSIRLEAKPFAMGLRAEHPQESIDEIRYRQRPRDQYLPASSYKLACQVAKDGVFSFCMCPGGLVVPSATSPGEIVVNGMSMSRRDSKFANSGIVVTVDEKKWKEHLPSGVFAGLNFQKELEQLMFKTGNGSQKAPAQKMTDFVAGKRSAGLNDTSYIPGLYEAPLHNLLPESLVKPLQQAMKIFGQKMKGFFTEEANLIALESRTSSPIRIPRDKETMMHSDAKGLFPCGEGAGYAGGILSAAMDGQNVARAVHKFLTN